MKQMLIFIVTGLFVSCGNSTPVNQSESAFQSFSALERAENAENIDRSEERKSVFKPEILKSFDEFKADDFQLSLDSSRATLDLTRDIANDLIRGLTDQLRHNTLMLSIAEVIESLPVRSEFNILAWFNSGYKFGEDQTEFSALLNNDTDHDSIPANWRNKVDGFTDSGSGGNLRIQGEFQDDDDNDWTSGYYVNTIQTRSNNKGRSLRAERIHLTLQKITKNKNEIRYALKRQHLIQYNEEIALMATVVAKPIRLDSSDPSVKNSKGERDYIISLAYQGVIEELSGLVSVVRYEPAGRDEGLGLDVMALSKKGYLQFAGKNIEYDYEGTTWNADSFLKAGTLTLRGKDKNTLEIKIIGKKQYQFFYNGEELK